MSTGLQLYIQLYLSASSDAFTLHPSLSKCLHAFVYQQSGSETVPTAPIAGVSTDRCKRNAIITASGCVSLGLCVLYQSNCLQSGCSSHWTAASLFCTFLSVIISWPWGGVCPSMNSNSLKFGLYVKPFDNRSE